MLPVFFAALLPLAAWASELPCLEELPLLSVQVTDVKLSGLESTALLARIPHRAEDPTWLSTAEALVIFRRDLQTFRWNAYLKLHFPSDAPYGIPFTFAAARVRIDEPAFETTLDWSLACSDTGHSIFPRQSFETVLPVNLPSTTQLRGLQLLLWGSRN